jgi:hypothetical protein
VSLKLFHNDVTSFKAIYLDFLHYPSLSHRIHNILETLSSETDHQEGTTLLGHLWSSCTKATAKTGICSLHLHTKTEEQHFSLTLWFLH